MTSFLALSLLPLACNSTASQRPTTRDTTAPASAPVGPSTPTTLDKIKNLQLDVHAAPLGRNANVPPLREACRTGANPQDNTPSQAVRPGLEELAHILGRQSHFGYKVHCGLDEGSSMVRTAVFTPSKVYASEVGEDLVSGD